ncbi:MAG: hypothetical protein WC707_05625 [Candidatus Babeliaceae bacterium]|jgi:hypothetical protein
MIHKKQTHLACLMLALLLHYNTGTMETDITQSNIFPITHLPTDIQNEIASYLFVSKNSRESIPQFEQRCIASLLQQKTIQQDAFPRTLECKFPSGKIIKSISTADKTSSSDPSQTCYLEEIGFIPSGSKYYLRLLSHKYSCSDAPHNQNRLSFSMSPDYLKVTIMCQYIKGDILRLNRNTEQTQQEHSIIQLADLSNPANIILKFEFFGEKKDSNALAVNSHGNAFAVIKKKLTLAKRKSHQDSQLKEHIDIISKTSWKKHAGAFMYKTSISTPRVKLFAVQHMYFNKQGTHICLLGSNCTEIETLQVSEAGHIQKDARKSDVSLAEFFHIRGICKNTNYTKIVGGTLKKEKAKLK